MNELEALVFTYRRDSRALALEAATGVDVDEVSEPNEQAPQLVELRQRGHETVARP